MRQAMLLMNNFVNSAISDLLTGFERWPAHDGRYSSKIIDGTAYRDRCTTSTKTVRRYEMLPDPSRKTGGIQNGTPPEI